MYIATLYLYCSAVDNTQIEELAQEIHQLLQVSSSTVSNACIRLCISLSAAGGILQMDCTGTFLFLLRFLKVRRKFSSLS